MLGVGEAGLGVLLGVGDAGVAVGDAGVALPDGAGVAVGTGTVELFVTVLFVRAGKH